ncbi:alcohol dehydrogenase catalytic domain-containing protein [Streptomyces sp. NPDC058086]|uniref:alcohol dehydrogenase catalytic domain-containing protein n=1 Tax=Streptomyces sp. NPDC058086 TaxID=3346334 RepID=UPI0036E5BCE4
MDRDLTAPGPGEVRVRVAVSGVNPTRGQARSGAAHPKHFSEVTPHLDGAGTIDAVGEGIDQSRVGRRVRLFMATAGQPTGTAAEFTVVPAERAVPLPDGAGFDVGASLGVPALTAHRAPRAHRRRGRGRGGRARGDPARPTGRRHRDQHDQRPYVSRSAVAASSRQLAWLLSCVEAVFRRPCAGHR